MTSVKINFRLVHLYASIFVFLIAVLYRFSVGINSTEKVLYLSGLIIFIVLVYAWKWRTIFELYEISDKCLKIYYSFFGLRVRKLVVKFEKVVKVERFHYNLIFQNKAYSLILNLEIEETELIITSQSHKVLFKSSNLDAFKRNDLETFETIFDNLTLHKI